MNEAKARPGTLPEIGSPGRLGQVTGTHREHRILDSLKSALRVLVALGRHVGQQVAKLRMQAKRIAATIWEKPKASSAKWKMDVRAASPRKLFRALHDFLDDLGYAHEYEPLKAERDAIGDVAIFKSELVGRKDCPTRDGLRLVLGILLLLTIALVPLAIRLLKTSGYLVRTIVRIGVEGEAYRARLGVQGEGEQEVLNVVSDARVTLDIRSGVAEGDCEISSPIKKKRELARTAEEEEKLKKALGELLSGMPSPAAGVPKVFLP